MKLAAHSDASYLSKPKLAAEQAIISFDPMTKQYHRTMEQFSSLHISSNM